MSQSDLAAESTNGGHDGDREHLPEGLVCPACGSKLVRRSMRRSLKDRFMSLLGKWPYRCQMCNMRFNGPQDPLSIAREQHEAEELNEDVHDEEESPETPPKPNDKADEK